MVGYPENEGVSSGGFIVGGLYTAASGRRCRFRLCDMRTRTPQAKGADQVIGEKGNHTAARRVVAAVGHTGLTRRRFRQASALSRTAVVMRYRQVGYALQQVLDALLVLAQIGTITDAEWRMSVEVPLPASKNWALSTSGKRTGASGHVDAYGPRRRPSPPAPV